MRILFALFCAKDKDSIGYMRKIDFQMRQIMSIFDIRYHKSLV